MKTFEVTKIFHENNEKHSWIVDGFDELDQLVNRSVVSMFKEDSTLEKITLKRNKSEFIISVID